MPRIFSHRMGSNNHPGPAGYRARHIDEAVKEAEWRGRDIAALDIRKGAAPSGGVIIIDDDLGMVRELSFEQINNTL